MMMRARSTLLTLVLGAGVALPASAQDQPLFGTEEDVDYAANLWQVLSEAELVGEDPIRTMPYEGREPHGAILEYLEHAITVDGHSDIAVVKKNYRGEQLTVDEVVNSPTEHLESVTVMYRRETGYDPDNANWFWAKYNPDGSLQTNPQGMQLAGRVAKGMDQGCIACHQRAPGDDYVYSHDKWTP